MAPLLGAPLDARLSSWQIRVLLHVAALLRNGEPRQVKHEALAHELRMRRSHATRSLGQFVRAGYIEQIPGSRPAVYRSAPDLFDGVQWCTKSSGPDATQPRTE